MTLDEHYICQRAANAIISEIGPYRVSTDALQAINQFLDEFIVLLLTSSLSLDLSQIKAVVFSLLPSTLGKNAIVEAELEVKTFTETESIDFELYERMRALSGSEFPLSEALPLLREKCFEFCTLADKEDQLYVRNSARIKKNEANMKVVISPIVAIYVTTVMEHIAEYLLTAVAMSAEHEDTDYVRVKEVFLALVDDVQLGNVFNRMDLKDKMGKRAGLYVKPTLPPTPSPLQQVKRSYAIDHNSETGSFLDITFDDLDLEYFEDNQRKSTLTIEPRIPEPVRPQSAMSNNNRKSTFHLFKNNRNSFSSDVLPRAASPDPSAVYDPDAPANAMNFEDLIKSGGTVRVSLTPNRLRSIEVKDSIKEDDTTLTWERRSISSPRLSTIPNNTNKSSVSIPPPKPVVRPQTPSSPLVNPAFAVSEAERFENPREAPKPPIADPALTIPVATPSASPSSKPVQKNPTPLSKLPPPADTPSPNHTEKRPGLTTIPSSHSPLSAPEQPPLPKPTATRSASGMVIRRGSMSNKKSRENLRKAKEEEERPSEKDGDDLTSPVEHKDTPSPPTDTVPVPRLKTENSSVHERPSSIVAKRTSMIGNSRRRSMHENYAAEKHQDISMRSRGSVSVSIKQWDDILKPGEQPQQQELVLPGSQRRSVLRQLRQQQLKEQQDNTILDKVLKFERASSLDDAAHRRVSHMPRRERFLYLQQDPSAIERKSSIISNAGAKTRNSVVIPRVKGIDQGIQTEPEIQQTDRSLDDEVEEEQGLVDGDEEWFLQDDEWDEQEETAIVEWLLGE
ncbi:hypothetical protein EDC96DRAFT_488063 [Choanephora cucurbitarum]|nr:hypothetical protein EDC96DRAFT_488063 [Choanephora cucurbitarum]